jgi:quercetin dioxygenase-like cupin family protein
MEAVGIPTSWNGRRSRLLVAFPGHGEEDEMSETTTARVLRAHEGMPGPDVGGVADRFMIDGRETGGRFALVQHLFAPRALAAPMHRHRDEDEFSYVLSGRIGAVADGVEVFGGPGDLIFKPRGQWHTFWNAGDEPAAVLELISPGGLEELFREMGASAEEFDPDVLAALASRYGCDLDFPATEPVVQRHGLVF